MADTSIDATRLEISGALQVIEPQIRGLFDLSRVTISPDLLSAVNARLADHSRRRDLLQAALAALDALTADGYPDTNPTVLSPALFGELTTQMADFDAALQQFEEEPAAESMILDLGSPVDKQES